MWLCMRWRAARQTGIHALSPPNVYVCICSVRYIYGDPRLALNIHKSRRPWRYVYVQANVFTPTGVHRGCANFAPATFLSQLWVHVYSYTRGYRHALSLYQALFARMCNYACVAQHRAPCGSPETAPAQSRDTSVRRRDPFSSQRI